MTTTTSKARLQTGKYRTALINTAGAGLDPRPGTHPPAPITSRNGGDSWQEEWQNLSQRSLVERGYGGKSGSRMALVSVDMLRSSDIRTVAVLQDPRILADQSSEPEEGLTFPPSPMFSVSPWAVPHSPPALTLFAVDMCTEAYEAFGCDVSLLNS